MMKNNSILYNTTTISLDLVNTFCLSLINICRDRYYIRCVYFCVYVLYSMLYGISTKLVSFSKHYLKNHILFENEKSAGYLETSNLLTEYEKFIYVCLLNPHCSVYIYNIVYCSFMSISKRIVIVLLCK